MRTNATGLGMTSLTSCQANRTRMHVRTEKGPSWTCHEITHPLSSQQHQSGSVKDSEKGLAGPGMRE